MMTFLFWLSAATVLYAYFGYALLLRLARPKPVLSASDSPQAHLPRISLILAARNEALTLLTKLENLRALDYPRELIETVVVSDGSTDRTAEILAGFPEVTSILLPGSGGKANALNHAVARASGDILVFFDTRQTVDRDALRHLVAPFADPSVGAVSGELLLESAPGVPSAEALGLYWMIEKAVRRLESRSGSVVGVTGAIYALRRSLFQPLPVGTILDDVLIPMNAARQGGRVLFEPAAIARDRIFSEPGREFGRKVRTLTGNYQMLRLAPWLLSPANPLLFRLVSHKLLRLLVPFLLLLMLLCSAFGHSTLDYLLLAAQLVFYGLAAAGALAVGLRRYKPVSLAYTFVMLNAAAALALWRFLNRKEQWS